MACRALDNLALQTDDAASDPIVGTSPKFVSALEIAKRVSMSNANIFISGESGSGKEVFARYIHNNSRRRHGPFVAINCSAIPETLLESELFGHAKGSFTGASDKRVGLFEEAEGGTLFLDEIGDLTLPLQAKLLRVLQEKKIKRVGENIYRPIDNRIISATHKDLNSAVQDCQFRDDLYFRLNVIPICVPPLRERKEDIGALAEIFLQRFAKENGSPAVRFTEEAIQYLQECEWPGNVRELQNSIERAVVLTSGPEVKREDFLPSNRIAPVHQDKHGFFVECSGELPSMEEVIQKYISFAVSHNNGAKDKTAKAIGIDRKTLYKRLKTEREWRAAGEVSTNGSPFG